MFIVTQFEWNVSLNKLMFETKFFFYLLAEDEDFSILLNALESKFVYHLEYKEASHRIGIPIVEIRLSYIHLMSTMEYSVMVRWHLFSCDQAALWMVLSVRPSVCLSHLFDYVPIIVSSWNFQELLPMTKVTSMQKVKVTEVNTQLSRFRTVTPVWIPIWWWNDAYSLMMLRRGTLLFFKVICQISRSHGSKKRRIWPRLGVSGL